MSTYQGLFCGIDTKRVCVCVGLRVCVWQTEPDEQADVSSVSTLSEKDWQQLDQCQTHTHTETQRHQTTHRDTHRHMRSETQRHRAPHKHTHRDTQPHTHILYIQTHTSAHTAIHRDTQRLTHTYTLFCSVQKIRARISILILILLTYCAKNSVSAHKTQRTYLGSSLLQILGANGLAC